jgi:hypothetical protein
MMEPFGRREFVAGSLGGLATWLVPPVLTPRLAGQDLVRTVAWRRLDGTGTEVCRLLHTGGGPTLNGVVTGVVAAAPIVARYTVQCTSRWEARRTDLEVEFDGLVRSLVIERDEGGGWYVDGEEQDALKGLRDVDLGITPATNTLPIRRLGLRPGQARPMAAAWVRFPDLSVRPLEQTYRNLGEGRYRYESRGGRFTADLVVDDQGLVIRYGDLWERSADWSP